MDKINKTAKSTLDPKNSAIDNFLANFSKKYLEAQTPPRPFISGPPKLPSISPLKEKKAPTEPSKSNFFNKIEEVPVQKPNITEENEYISSGDSLWKSLFEDLKGTGRENFTYEDNIVREKQDEYLKRIGLGGLRNIEGKYGGVDEFLRRFFFPAYRALEKGSGEWADEEGGRNLLKTIFEREHEPKWDVENEEDIALEQDPKEDVAVKNIIKDIESSDSDNFDLSFMQDPNLKTLCSPNALSSLSKAVNSYLSSVGDIEKAKYLKHDLLSLKNDIDNYTTKETLGNTCNILKKYKSILDLLPRREVSKNGALKTFSDTVDKFNDNNSVQLINNVKESCKEAKDFFTSLAKSMGTSPMDVDKINPFSDPDFIYSEFLNGINEKGVVDANDVLATREALNNFIDSIVSEKGLAENPRVVQNSEKIKSSINENISLDITDNFINKKEKEPDKLSTEETNEMTDQKSINDKDTDDFDAYLDSQDEADDFEPDSIVNKNTEYNEEAANINDPHNYESKRDILASLFSSTINRNDTKKCMRNN